MRQEKEGLPTLDITYATGVFDRGEEGGSKIRGKNVNPQIFLRN